MNEDHTLEEESPTQLGYTLLYICTCHVYPAGYGHWTAFKMGIGPHLQAKKLKKNYRFEAFRSQIQCFKLQNASNL